MVFNYYCHHRGRFITIYDFSKEFFMTLKKIAFAVLLSSSLSSSLSFASPILTPVDYNPATTSNAWVEIDEAGFLRNIDRIKSKVGDKVLICAIVKADAYGNSIDLLTPALIKSGIACAGIGSNEEARVMRSHNYKGRLIRVRTSSLDEVKGGLPYDIEEFVGSIQHAKNIDEVAKKNNKIIKIHLAVNAGGLSRNGVELATEQGMQEALEITKLKNLKITGMMTHYPVKEENDIKGDLKLFNEQTDKLIKMAGLNRKDITLHTANTYATLNFPETHLDAVRPGGALYGASGPSELGFEHINNFKTKVASINSYPKGNTVGYDRSATLERDSRLANLPVGFSDGFRRAPEGKTVYVLIRGHRIPIVGKISMNTAMADVTDFPDIQEGDEVVIFGKQKGEQITQAEIESAYDTTISQLYTIWGNSNPRILINKAK